MCLLENLPPLYEHLITALEIILINAMEYVMAHFIHKMSKRKEKKPQGDDYAQVFDTRQITKTKLMPTIRK